MYTIDRATRRLSLVFTLALAFGAVLGTVGQDSPGQDSPGQDSPAQDSPAQDSAAQQNPAQGRGARQNPTGDGQDGAASLRGRIRTLSYEARLVALADGSSWIRNGTEIRAVFAGRLEDLVALLCDYEGSPKVFPRIESVRVRSSEGGVAVTEQRSIVRILGFEYVSNLVFRNELKRASPTAASLTFTMIDGDGSCRSVEGGWDLESLESGGPQAVLVTYRCDMLVLPRYPLQLQIMQLFGKADYEHMVSELGSAFAARNASGTPGARVSACGAVSER